MPPVSRRNDASQQPANPKYEILPSPHPPIPHPRDPSQCFSPYRTYSITSIYPSHSLSDRIDPDGQTHITVLLPDGIHAECKPICIMHTHKDQANSIQPSSSAPSEYIPQTAYQIRCAQAVYTAISRAPSAFQPMTPSIARWLTHARDARTGICREPSRRAYRGK